MKKLLLLTAMLLLSGWLLSPFLNVAEAQTVITAERVKITVTNGDSSYQIARTIKDTSYIEIREINNQIAALQTEKDAYQALIATVNEKLAALRARKQELKQAAQ